MLLLFKYLLTAGIVVLASELAKRSDNLGALIASLPMVTFLVLIWLHVEKQPMDKIANHAFYTFWYVVPTLPMFLIFPYLYSIFGFWIALAQCVVLTVALFLIWALLLKQFGIELL